MSDLALCLYPHDRPPVSHNLL